MKEKKASLLFTPIMMSNIYNRAIQDLDIGDCSEQLLSNKEYFLTGEQILTGIPFLLGNDEGNNLLLLKDQPAVLSLEKPAGFRYIVFLHGADFHGQQTDKDGFIKHSRGNTITGETVAEYVLCYEDGSRHAVQINRRLQINEFQGIWGEDGLVCVPHTKPELVQPASEWINSKETGNGYAWGRSQTRVGFRGNNCILKHWLYALENPKPDKTVTSIEFIPKNGTTFIFGCSTTDMSSHPLRWNPEKRIKIHRKDFDRNLVDIDLGAITSITKELIYDNDNWESSVINSPPAESEESFIIEYTAHSEAVLYYDDLPLKTDDVKNIQICSPKVKVVVKIADKNSKPVAVKLHIHGVHGEYLPPIARHRYPNSFWFEDYSADFTTGKHFASYINGRTDVMLPIGEVFVEVTKGLEIIPVRKKYNITPETGEILITVNHVLPWRSNGWVSADTHVHFLSPHTALLEGSGEGVNVVNLLASQWGELFTNVGDFDGKTTLGSVESGGDGEYLVRVGTENRQPVMGHISLIGYEGDMILPLTSGGPNEARIGDAVETSLSIWAEQNRKQKGINVLPHFPNPRAEAASTIVLGLIDAVEMTSWSYIFKGINPYSLSEWYKYLNCGFNIPAVGGSDKMSSAMPVGGLRTYARINDELFTYESWKKAISKGLTFVTCGPLIDFLVDGKEVGSRILLDKNGGSLDINWHVASLVVTVTRIQVIYNGEVVESKTIDTKEQDNYGKGSVQVKESGWIALRVMGRFEEDSEEIVAAHTSAVMVTVGDKPVYSNLDAMAILEQIEGATAYIKTIAPIKDEHQYAEILSRLTAAHRKIHNMMHENGAFHDHSNDFLHHHQ